MTLSDALTWLAILLAVLSAVSWIKAATSQVLSDRRVDADDRAPVGMIVLDGGHIGDPSTGGVFLKTKAGWIDLPDTMKLQSRWNAWAAWLSAATAIATALAQLALKFRL